MIQRGFIVHPSASLRGGSPLVELFGRLESGATFWIEEDRLRPRLFVPRGQETALRASAAARIQETALHDLRGRPLLRVEAPRPDTLQQLRQRLEAAGGEALEADLPLATRYLIDHGLGATLAIDGEGEEIRPGCLRFSNPSVAPADAQVALRSLSIDLETTPDAGRILSVALFGDEAQEVHLLARRPVRGAICHGDEAELLHAVAERIRELDPDILLGWNVVDFDLRVWLARCQAQDLGDGLGRIPVASRLLGERGPRRQVRGEVVGRMVLDGIPLVRDALRLPDYRLDTVARALLGRGKKIDRSAPNPAAEILRMYREDPEALVAYNLEDARLVPEILGREGLLELAVERSRLTGMPLDRVGASVASFDRLYLPELGRRGIVAPSADPGREPAPVHGGALLEPRPGLYRDVAVFDWRSLYPSLIRTFHLDPLAHARAGEGALVAPNGARFDRGDAILPALIERLQERREAAQGRGDVHARQAIKIIMNALFGVLGTPACRFFDPEIANAITSFGQQTLHWSREAFEATGVEVLYGDTDSVFVQLPEEPEPALRRARAERLRAHAEEEIARRIRSEYEVEPRLQLELQRIFDRLLLPRLRGGRGGSKKRYAGLADGRLVVVGLEAVRRDWPEVAQRLQQGLLERLFAGRELIPFVREMVEQVRSGELDEELVTTKRVRKGSVDRYTANAPHVQAARKAGATPGGVIRYVLTATGPEPVLPGKPLPAAIDYEHYVEKVLRPVAEGILSELGLGFDEALGRPHQLDLL